MAVVCDLYGINVDLPHHGKLGGHVVLALVKDSWPALNSVMASLTGHHWRTHALADVIVFVLLGSFFTARRIPGGKLTNGLAVTVGAATVIASLALGLWFLFV